MGIASYRRFTALAPVATTMNLHEFVVSVAHEHQVDGTDASLSFIIDSDASVISAAQEHQAYATNATLCITIGNNASIPPRIAEDHHNLIG